LEKEPVKVLIIDDEPGHIHWMSMVYKDLGLSTFGALNLEEAKDILTKENPDIVTIETYIHGGHLVS
jgi:CheY-like chemotaxis protein